MDSIVPSNVNLERMHRIMQVKFGVDLSEEQLGRLLQAQSEILKRALQKEEIDLSALDLLIDSVSEQITGMRYHTDKSTSYYKEHYQKKLSENKIAFFSRI
ncbi:hypothetical protein [Cesiribacter sp. SM1]|uniref:hypothetical protein n=1 Tax=Cesiribacter sp. SM1 TaxID=2861196 RepID=UPI001CD59C23|nr:hypothetical protein [Cesiribacter sp. SM1]